MNILNVRVLATARLLAQRTVHEYGEDNCGHMAAAISYYVLFSIVPLAVFLVSIFGLVVRGDRLQQDVSERIVEFLDVKPGDATIRPAASVGERLGSAAVTRIERSIDGLSQEERNVLASRIEAGQTVDLDGRTLAANDLSISYDNIVVDTIRGVSHVSGALTFTGLIGIAWSASAMFSAIRRSLNIAWDIDVKRPIVQQKLLDLAMVLGLGVLLALSIASTTALRVLRHLSDSSLGPLSSGTGFLWSGLPLVLPAAFTYVVFLLVYRLVPNVRHGWRDVWLGALLATVLFEILKNGFAIYIANVGNFDAVYGSLGVLLLFMLWTYLAASILLLGAELASEYPRVLSGRYDEESSGAAPSPPLATRMRRMVRGLFVHDRGH
jgi:membrane protein